MLSTEIIPVMLSIEDGLKQSTRCPENATVIAKLPASDTKRKCYKIMADSTYETSGGSRMISGEVRFDQTSLPTLCIRTVLSKQYKSRSDAAERGVWSGSTLFATYAAIFNTFI